jgi:hypothetical protein
MSFRVDRNLGILTLVTAIAISIVAAWYSIVGLAAIFSAAVIPIIIMGSVLEVGKLVTASWLYRNWKQVPKLLKTYLTAAVVMLMLITSMGIFGFLSKAHLDQTLPSDEMIAKIERIDMSITRENRRIRDAELVIQQLDDSVQVLLSYDRVRGKGGAIATRKNQKPERDELNIEIADAQGAIDILVDKKFPLQQKVRNLEADIGPVKYIAALIYGDQANNFLDECVRAVILALVFVFDPLAILMLVAANMSLFGQVGSLGGVREPEAPAPKSKPKSLYSWHKETYKKQPKKSKVPPHNPGDDQTSMV